MAFSTIRRRVDAALMDGGFGMAFVPLRDEQALHLARTTTAAVTPVAAAAASSQQVERRIEHIASAVVGDAALGASLVAARR